jgi:hypothetical protein
MRVSCVPVLALFLVGCGLIDQINGPNSLAIQRFVASPDDVSSGASVTLTWDVQGAEAVKIDNGVGVVPAKGTKTFPAYRTVTYTLTAKSGTSSATASVQVSVKGSTSDPFVFLQPSPSPEPTPSPSPSPSPGTDEGCGTPVVSADGCTITIEQPDAPPKGQCLVLTKLSVDESCPVSVGKSLKVEFEITADSGKEIFWRPARNGKDEIEPSKGGRLQATGTSNVKLTDKVVGDSMAIEVADGDGKIYLRFSLAHQ